MDEKPRVKLIYAIQKIVADAEADEASAAVAAIRANCSNHDKNALAAERSQIALALRCMGDSVIALVNIHWPDDRESPMPVKSVTINIATQEKAAP
jgi:hypothetical protein